MLKSSINQEKPLWRLTDIDKVKDLKFQLNFAEKHIYQDNTDINHDDEQKFHLKVNTLSSKFTQDFALFRKSKKFSSTSKFKSAIQLTKRFEQYSVDPINQLSNQIVNEEDKSSTDE